MQAPADAPAPSQPPANDPAAAATDPQSASSAPASAVDPIAALTAERDHAKEQLLRTAADFDNYRKRARREVEEARMRGKDDAIRDVLPVFDNLERAVAASDSAQNVTSVVEGVKMVLKLFVDTTERMGLQRVPTVGNRFDPAMHEAIQQKETDEAVPGTILMEVTPGYMFGQRLLRAAMVVVARKPAPKAADCIDAPEVSPAADAADGGRPSQAPSASDAVQTPSNAPKAEDGGTSA